MSSPGNNEADTTAEPAASATPQDLEFSIVSGAKEDLLFGCLMSLESVMRSSIYTWSVTVTCNTPGDGLADRLSHQFPFVKAVENTEARGFAANHNRVLENSSARYVWLLNDDLVLLAGSVDKVVEYMDEPGNSRVAVVSPKLLNPDGSLQPSTYSFPTMPQILLAYSGLRERPFTDRLLRIAAPVLRARPGSSRFWDHGSTVVVDTLRGACVAVRMAAVHDVGPMVEVSIVGGEETEWHHRFREHGWTVVFFADASVIHHGSQTVKSGARSFYPEYLKGALHFFKARRSATLFGFYCSSLLAVFGARLAVARLRGDATGVDLARRYAAVTREAMTRLAHAATR